MTISSSLVCVDLNIHPEFSCLSLHSVTFYKSLTVETKGRDVDIHTASLTTVKSSR